VSMSTLRCFLQRITRRKRRVALADARNPWLANWPNSRATWEALRHILLKLLLRMQEEDRILGLAAPNNPPGCYVQSNLHR